MTENHARSLASPFDGGVHVLHADSRAPHDSPQVLAIDLGRARRLRDVSARGLEQAPHVVDFEPLQHLFSEFLVASKRT